MSDPFLGEIRIFGFNFAPKGWALCNGQTLAISQNTALFALLGTFYGGNGTSTFNLPDLRGRVPVHQGQGAGLSNYVIGEVTGTESVTLLSTQMPAHNHQVEASDGKATSKLAQSNFLAKAASNQFATTSDGSTMNAAMLTQTGGGQPHSNIQPLLVMTACIALTGIFPSRS